MGAQRSNVLDLRTECVEKGNCLTARAGICRRKQNDRSVSRAVLPIDTRAALAGSGPEKTPARSAPMTEQTHTSLTLRLPQQLRAEIEREARELGVSESMIARWRLQTGYVPRFHNESRCAEAAQ